MNHASELTTTETNTTPAPEKLHLHGRVKDLTGKTFGSLTVEALDGMRPRKKGNRYFWRCRCQCGNVVAVDGADLRTGAKKHCGCMSKGKASIVKLDKTELGPAKSGTPEYHAYHAMLQRCYNRKHSAYSRWGGKGREVCARWRESFANFLADMGPRPGPGYSIERRDNNRTTDAYAPDNCYWATRQEQQRNTSRNVFVLLDGVTMTAIEWSERLGVSPATLWSALRSGVTIEEFIEKRKHQPEFHDNGEMNLKSAELRKRIAETVNWFLEADEENWPRVYTVGEIADVLDLGYENTRRILRGIQAPDTPQAAKLVEFLEKNLKSLKTPKPNDADAALASIA